MNRLKKILITFILIAQFVQRNSSNSLTNPSSTVKSVPRNIVSTNGKEVSTTLSPENVTEPILPEWGGNCTKKHWTKCSNLTKWVTSHYVNIKRKELGFKYQVTNCTIQPPICLKNGWTVTKCQLLCMRCNREILSKYDKYVAGDGEC